MNSRERAMRAVMNWLWSAVFRIVAVVVPALILITLPTIADPPSQKMLRVGYEEFRPYSFTDENGLARGYSIDLIRELARDGGYQGMGLGLFIARTLLERTGATLSFANGTDGLRKGEIRFEIQNPELAQPTGAIIELVWPAHAMVVPKGESRRALGENLKFEP